MKTMKLILTIAMLYLVGIDNLFGQVSANTQTVYTTSSCSGCHVLNPANCVDDDPQSYSIYDVDSALIGESIYHRLNFPETAAPGSKVIILLQDDDLNDLYYSSIGNISVSSINNNISGHENFNPSSGDLNRVESTSFYTLEFNFETEFDAIEIEIRGCSCNPDSYLRIYSAGFISNAQRGFGQLIDFNLYEEQDDVRMIWSISSEEGLTDYKIERSDDGIKYNEIGSVQSSGNSSSLMTYLFYDRSPMDGFNYYRIHVTDLNGNTIYFLPQVIEINDSDGINLYPNPSNGSFQIKYSGDEGEIFIYDLAGQLLFTKKVSAKNDETISVSEWELSNLQDGFYKLIMVCKEEIITENLLIKRKL
jgi:hypothetical protein